MFLDTVTVVVGDKDLSNIRSADGYYNENMLDKAIVMCMEKNKYFNLEALLDDEYLEPARDDDNAMIEYSEHKEILKDETSSYDKVVLRYG